MPELHPEEFLALLRKSRLLTSAQELDVQKITKQSGMSGAEPLARELVNRKILTRWHADQLLKGQTGFVLEQYRLLSPVGKGGMGHVFRAQDTRNGKTVAIKVMSRKLSGNKALVNRFRREIRASSLLNDIHIVRTLDAGCVGKVDFMVMEYVNGDQLDHIVSRLPVIPVPMACDVIRQVALGLQHAHAQQMVHRDIKPANLIVDWAADGTGTVKIMDMGLVLIAPDGNQQTTMTRAGQVMGTPDYMSPEQGWNTANVDIRSDIYSLGCTFFRLLTGRVPFPGDNPLQVLMARCSKDAPPASTLRPDLPEAINSIVRRMTLRDPAARFQTPQEVADALAPFSVPLTMDGLRSALHDAGDDDAVVLELADDSQEPQDAGYQQFLREMGSGAAVDLMMLSTSGTGPSLGNTIPIIPLADPRRAAGRRNSSLQSSRLSRNVMLISGGGLAALLALAYSIYQGESNSSIPVNAGSVASGGNQASEPASLKAELATPPRQDIKAGAVLSYQPKFTGPTPVIPSGTTLRFEAGQGAPAGVHVDPASGLVTWTIAASQTPADYEIPVRLMAVNSGKSRLVATVRIPARVTPGTHRYEFPVTDAFLLKPGVPFESSLKVAHEPAEESLLRYRLESESLPGMQIDEKTGLFTWTPTADDFGRHNVTVRLQDSTTSEVLATGTITLVVRPDRFLPEYPEQNAVAGTMFRMSLMNRVPRFLARGLKLRVGEGSPDGVELDVKQGTLEWNVPADASGKHEIRLLLESAIPRLNIPPETATIVVQVKSSASPSMAGEPGKNGPDDPAEVAKALEELRESLKREIGSARTSTERLLLAVALLDKAIDEPPGAANLAMLDLVTEVAQKAKASEVLFELARMRSQRYGGDEIALSVPLAEEFRPQSAGVGQSEGIIEHCLRVAQVAAAKGEFAAVGKLLKVPSVLLRKSDRGTIAGMLNQDVQEALTIAGQLAEDGERSTIREDQLNLILNRWQFKSLFDQPTALGYIDAGGNGARLPDGGRSLWEIGAGRVFLQTAQRTGSLGILDLNNEPGRCLIRLQLSARTTSAMLIFGAARDQNLNAHILTIDRSEFGKIITAPGGSQMVGPATSGTFGNAGWNEVEVLIDGTDAHIRLNGVAAASASLPSLKPGRIGLLLSLDRSAEPLLEIRRPRILILPDP
jgi:serine/threonine protein kinase